MEWLVVLQGTRDSFITVLSRNGLRWNVCEILMNGQMSPIAYVKSSKEYIVKRFTLTLTEAGALDRS